MDWSALSLPSFGWELVVSVLEIVLIDLVLAGDNAVVIALAVKSLPRRQRMYGIAFGTIIAVVLRIALTFFAAQLLMMKFVKLVGGVLIYWIGVKLLLQDVTQEDGGREASTLMSAVWIILVADATMSLDNILALAGASKGNLFLLLFGLALSIPLVVGTSSLLSRLMDRFPVIVYLGAAILGKVAAEMIFTDSVVAGVFPLPHLWLRVLEAVGAGLVVITALVWAKLTAAGRRNPGLESDCRETENSSVLNTAKDC
jgi:YjbE family integral membrane protein